MVNSDAKRKLFNKSRTPWVVEHLFSKNNPISLLCFPYAGGNTHAFSHWARFLPDTCNLLAIQYPGRLGLIGISPEKQVEDLVVKLYDHILPYLETDKIIFFGHSLGALVSFELAKYIEKNGHNPIDALFVSACVSPELVGKKRGIHHLSDEDFLEKISSYGGTPSELLEDKELMNFFIPVLKSDFYMYENYKLKLQERVNCPIFVIGSPDDPYAPVEEMKNWSFATSAEYKLIPVIGDHFYIHDNQSDFSRLFQQHFSTIFSERA